MNLGLALQPQNGGVVQNGTPSVASLVAANSPFMAQQDPVPQPPVPAPKSPEVKITSLRDCFDQKVVAEHLKGKKYTDFDICKILFNQLSIWPEIVIPLIQERYFFGILGIHFTALRVNNELLRFTQEWDVDRARSTEALKKQQCAVVIQAKIYIKKPPQDFKKIIKDLLYGIQKENFNSANLKALLDLGLNLEDEPLAAFINTLKDIQKEEEDDEKHGLGKYGLPIAEMFIQLTNANKFNLEGDKELNAWVTKKAEFCGSSQLLRDAVALIGRNPKPRLQKETDDVCHFKGLIQFVKPSDDLIGLMGILEPQISDQKQLDEPRRIARQVLWRVIAEYIPMILSHNVIFRGVPMAKRILSWLLEEPQMLCFWNPDLNRAQAACCQALGQLVSAGVKVLPEQKKDNADNLSVQENIEVECSPEQEMAIELLVHRINSDDPALAKAASEALAAILMTFSPDELNAFILVLAKKVMQDELPEDSRWNRCVQGIDIKPQDFVRVVMPLLKAEPAQANRILYGTIAKYLKERVQGLKAGDPILDAALNLQVALAPAEQTVNQQQELRTTICSSAPELTPDCVNLIMSYCCMR